MAFLDDLQGKFWGNIKGAAEKTLADELRMLSGTELTVGSEGGIKIEPLAAKPTPTNTGTELVLIAAAVIALYLVLKG